MEQLTEEKRQWLLDNGCDPACHVCGRKLEIGDRYDTHVLIPGEEIFTRVGVVMGSVRGTTCAACIEEDRSLPEAERVKACESLRAVLERLGAPISEPTPVAEAKPKDGPRTSPGCFFMEDGTPF